MSKIFVVFFILGFGVSLQAQPPSLGNRGAGLQTGQFYGKILDAKTGKPVDAASVQLITTHFDLVTKQRKDTIINGMLTKSNGDFLLENVPVMGDYTLKITAISYKEVSKKVSFFTPDMQKKLKAAFEKTVRSNGASTVDSGKQKPAPNMVQMIKDALGGDLSKLAGLGDKDLGNIKIEQAAEELANVTVTASKSMVLAVDRKIFNVDKTIAASGGTATEIMRQIPSVNVDIDGNVTVRNTAPTLFIDGRPTTLSLDQIPADEIQSVELITNPSAKFAASGGGAAILNVIMKKNRKPGYNGSLRAGIDSRARPNAGAELNIRQGKFNTSVSGQLGYRKRISASDINTQYSPTGTAPATNITQDVDNINRGLFGSFKGGIDYFIDNRNTLSASLSYVKGLFRTNEVNNMRYDSLYTPVQTNFSLRNTDGKGTFENRGAALSFKHNFTKSGHEFTADANVNSMKMDNNANYNSQAFTVSQTPNGNAIKQLTHSGSTSRFVVIQSDYANPISENLKIEAGVQAQARDYTSLNDNSFYNYERKTYVKASAVSSNYHFTDQVYAAYVSTTGKVNNFGYNLGLRAESSDYKGGITGLDSNFRVNYPISLFPSAFLSYKLSDKSDVQINYTRRINRPNFFQLIPFIDYTDPLNLRVGNPALTPEFTNSVEANYTYQFNNKHNILVSTFHKSTNSLITNTQYKGLNPANSDSTIFNTFVNASSSIKYGVELTSRDVITKKFDVTTNLNFYNASINSNNLKNGQINKQNSFFGKVTLTQKIGKTNQWTMQLNGDYQSKSIVPVNSGGGGGGGGRGGFMMGGGIQPAGSNGYVNPNYGADFSIKRDIIKNKSGQGYLGSITLSMNDIFRTRIYDVNTSSSFFYQTLTRRRDPRIIRLQFSWRFGKIDAQLFRRKNVKGYSEGLQNSMNDVQ